MAYWTPRADWMAFPRLDDGAGISGAFTLAYKITDDQSGEVWSRRFDRFKAKNRTAFAGGGTLMKGAIRPLVADLGFDVGRAVFLAALSSGETEASADGQLPLIARACADAVGASFQLSALTKKIHRRLHNIYNAADRQAEIEKAEYNYAKTSNKEKTFVVVDDFITMGTTLSKIAHAILSANPNSVVYGVALAKTERLSWIPSLSNNHVPQKWNELWERGEQRYRERQNG
jgi:Phosphoribosyl transferase domain